MFKSLQKAGWLTDKDYNFVFHRTPRLCADLIVTSPQGILLTQRDIEPFKGTWGFPGGRIFYEESLAIALRRIASDEVGIKISNEKFLGFMEMLDEAFRLKNFVHTISLGFLVDYISGDLRGNKDAKQVKFFTEIPAKMHPYHRQFLTDHFNEIWKKFS